MTIGANSYGSVTGVAGLVPRYTVGQTFDTTTRPTATQVESYIDSVSGIVNSMLAQSGFTIPIANDSVKDALDLFVNDEVGSIAEGINGAGRFGPRATDGVIPNRFKLLFEDVKLFIVGNADGFERLGAARQFSFTSGLAFRDTDESGDATNPIFQRSAFGNVFENWDQ